MRHVPTLLPAIVSALLLGTAAPAWAQDAGLRGPLSDPPEQDDVFSNDDERPDDATDTGRPRPPIFDDAAADGADDDDDEERRERRRRGGPAARAEEAARSAGAATAAPVTAGGAATDGARREAGRPENNTRVEPASRATRVGTRQVDGSLSPLSNPRLTTLQGGFRRTPPGPYEPLGVRLGPLRLTGTLEQGIGYTTNADFARDGRSSAVSDTRASLTAVSELPVHEFRGTLRAGTLEYLNGTSEGTPNVDAEAAFRYDWRRDTSLTLGTTYGYTTESASDDDIVVPAGVALDGRPGVHRYSLYGEAARGGGRLSGRLRTTIAREQYEDGRLSDGTRLVQDDRDLTIFRGTLRAGYEHTVAVQPFVEAELGYRLHDNRVDSAGFERDGTQYALRAGVALDFGAKLSGEIAAGLEGFIYESSRLEDIVGPSASAVLTWAPDRLTSVVGTVQTRLDPATVAGRSGSLAYDAFVDVTRDIRPNVALTGLAGIGYQDFDGAREDLTWRVEAGALYRFNRALGIQARVGHRRVDSSVEASSYDATTATIGLRLQK